MRFSNGGIADKRIVEWNAEVFRGAQRSRKNPVTQSWGTTTGSLGFARDDREKGFRELMHLNDCKCAIYD